VRSHLSDGRIEMTTLGDFYPSGDEYELVYAATGRLIPPAGIPLQVGCVVNNVETLYKRPPGHPGNTGNAQAGFDSRGGAAAQDLLGAGGISFRELLPWPAAPRLASSAFSSAAS